MDPNSQHQRWSKWWFVVHPGGSKWPTFPMVREAAATYARLHFGMTTAMEVREEFNFHTNKTEWHIKVRSEGHPVHDPDFVEAMTRLWERWVERGFGPGSRLEVREAKLEAGDRQDGSPRDQLIIMDASLMPNLRDDLAKMRREQDGK